MRILYFDGLQLRALRHQRGANTEEGCFVADAAGYEAFAYYLKARAKDRYLLLADLHEESYQVETLPHVSGADRAALHKRRLGQYFYGTPFSLARSLGRAKDGRRDEQVLFAALTRPESLQPWLDLIEMAGVPFVGVHSAALLLAERPASLLAGFERCLLLNFSSAGLRQTYFAQGRLQFSRLANVSGNTPDVLAQACASEAAKTVQYLRGQRLIGRDALSTVILAQGDLLPALRTHCVEQPDNRFTLRDLAEFSAACGLRAVPESSRADALLCHLLVHHAPAEQFAPPAARRIYRLWRARRALYASACCIALAALGFAVFNVIDSAQHRERAAALRAQAAADEARYQQLLATLPKIPLANDALRAVLARQAELQARSPEMLPMLTDLGRQLERQPGIELHSLEWRNSLTPGRNSPRQVTGATPAAGLLAVKAHLPAHLIGDQRAQLARIDQLAEALRQRGYSVEIIETPVNIESARTLRSQSERGAQATTLDFEILISKLAGAAA